MRLWSLDPQYLDRQGLTACWREALLAQAVLAGRTRGYLNHSQLHRFRAQADPVAAVGAYLVGIAAEATTRGYRFDTGRIDRPAAVAGDGTLLGERVVPERVVPERVVPGGVVPGRVVPERVVTEPGVIGDVVAERVVSGGSRVVAQLPVTDGQLAHEWRHLSLKLAGRSPERAAAQARVESPAAHPLFVVVPGPVEPWERGAS
ncbi:pyrimidine dimer DNA glycosylase/endonuclease V [Georgenia subflava]|uniref:Pyrimidine dimer DNA glycosylase n=1 Tax=Georgenia subflava TaxID=1622177 RepID=A0A6N7ELZ9_9MICO|nr:pyrimidine dimer DNA glycosylase [Georgenia subflava]